MPIRSLRAPLLALLLFGSAFAATSDFVTVKRGDTLTHIARSHGLSLARLRALNGLKSSTIQPGLRLRVRAAPPAPKQSRVVWAFVTARRGDSLVTLAKRYHTSTLKLMQLNHQWTPALYAGQRVMVPRHLEVAGPPKPKGVAVRVSSLRVLNVPITVARVDLSRPDVLVAPVMPQGGIGHTGARVSTLARLSGAELVVNGGYFHPRTFAVAGDVVASGRLIAWGSSPVALAVTYDNRARILPAGASASWAGYETVVAGGPRVLAGGQPLWAGLRQGFSDPAIFGRRNRTMLGLRSQHELLLIVTRAPITVTEAGKVLRALGARDGMLLDGGTSSGMAYRGQAVLESGRRVAYGLGVHVKYVGRRFMR